jgi:hypothetical protein
MKRKLLIGCGVAGILGIGLFVGFVAVVIAGAFALTRPVVDASEQFLTMLGQDKIDEAYSSTAAGFRARLDTASFGRSVKQLGLTEYASVTWNSRQIENDQGAAEGVVTTKDGETRPVSIRLVREGGRWAVVGVRYGGVELVSTNSTAGVPPEAELDRMVRESLLAFNQAVRAGNFTTFHAQLADTWKKEITPQRLQAVFQEFVDKGIDIGPIKDVKPRLAPAASINDRGVLTVAGQYPTQPSHVRFELEYAYEKGRWSLSGITVNVGS